MVDDISLMDIAVKESWRYQGLTYPNPAVGAVISDDIGSVIACEAHHQAGFPHAEVEVCKTAYLKLTNDTLISNTKNSNDIHKYLMANHNNIFKNLTLHVTLEPCNHYGKTPPCSKLIKELGFKRVVVGKLDENIEASGGVKFLKENGVHVELLKENKACEDLLMPFLRWQKENFVFFKLAMSLNGVIDGGIITGLASRQLVHKFRDSCDLLVIGGNTVRQDRPTLDVRLCGGKAPDILIYSRKEEFDKNIPLFNIKNRKVFISNSFDILKNYKNIMIEGGEGMLKATKEITDLYAIFHSPNFKKGKHPNLDLSLERLSLANIKKDTLSWLKKL